MISRRRLPGLLAVALCALAASAASASAALPEFSSTKISKGEHVTFTDTSGESRLETAAHNPVICKASTSKGEITGPKTVGGATVTYTGCTQGVANCQNEGTGVIKTNPLTGTLSYISESEKRVKETLKPESGTEFVKFKCGTVGVIVTGSVSGEAKPVNISQTTGELIFAKAGGLVAFSEAATLTSTDKITFAEAVALKA